MSEPIHPSIEAITFRRTAYGTITLPARAVECMSPDHDNHARARRLLEITDAVLEVFEGARLVEVRAP